MTQTPEWRFKWVVGPIITLFLVSIGFLGSWFTVQANVDELKADQTEITVRVKTTEDNINNIKIKDAEQSQIVKDISKSLKKIEEQTSSLPRMQADLEIMKDKVR